MDYTPWSIPSDWGMAPDPVTIASLYEALQKLSDPRRRQGKRYELALILCLLVLAKLAGQTSLSGATEWIRHRGAALAQRFGLRRKTMPCQMTYCKVLARVDGKQLDEILSAFACRDGKRKAGVEMNRVAYTRRPARPSTRIWPSMAKPFVPPVRSLIPFISSVVTRWALASSYGTAMCRRKRMRAARSNHYCPRT
jgi:hypothetical protein